MKFLSKLICILFLLVSLTIVQSSSVEAAFPGYNGSIAFYGIESGANEVYLVDLQGDALLQLTEDEFSNSRPRWSPDGSKLAVVSDRDGNYEIYLFDLNSREFTRLTDNPANDDTPTWSPDGTKIAFRSDRDGNQEIYVMNADGTGVERLTTNSNSDTVPDWSPDGAKIAFQSNRDGNFEIYTMDSDGDNVHRVTNHESTDMDPRWSPDGQRLVFSSLRHGNTEIVSTLIDGNDYVRLTDNSSSDLRPTYSPDGNYIGFVSNRDGDYEVFRMNADGSNPIQLTFNSTTDNIPDWQPIPNKKPTVIQDVVTVAFNTSKSIDVLANDTDEEALDSQYLTIKSQPANGTAKVVNGKVEYSPKKDFFGSDELTYQICDSFLLDQKCSTGVLSINVQAGPKPPAPKIEKVGSVELNNSNKVYYTSNRPTFSGKAEPFATIKIEIHSDPIVLTTTADAEGNWSVTPDQDIPNGEHSVKITTIKDGVESDPVSFVLGINVGLAETGSAMLPIIVAGLVGALGIVSGKYLKKRVAE